MEYCFDNTEKRRKCTLKMQKELVMCQYLLWKGRRLCVAPLTNIPCQRASFFIFSSKGSYEQGAIRGCRRRLSAHS